MKILINGLLLNRRYSGVEVSIVNLASALASLPLEKQDAIKLIVPSEWREPDISSQNFFTQRINIKAHIRPLRIAFEQLVLPRIAAKDQADILHCPGYIASLFSSAPVALSVYDCHVFACPQFCRLANILHYRMLFPSSLKKASIIIVPSEHTLRELSSLFPWAEEKCRLIPLGVSKLFRRIESQTEIQRVREIYGLPSAPFILFAGRTDKRKNVSAVLKAFALIKKGKGSSFQHKLVIAGSEGDALTEIKKLIKINGMDSEVFFTGFVSSSDMPIIYNMADCFAFLSFHEGFGLPPLEAMACGVPVVASNNTATGEITKGAALQVAPNDIKGAAEAIEKMLKDKTLRNTLIAKGITHAARYMWEKTAELTMRAYYETRNISK